MKIIRRIFVILLVLLQITSVVFAEGVVVTNGFVEYEVNEEDGRFSIRTETGSTYLPDDDQPLLYEALSPETSFTTFIIGGKPYIFGHDYGYKGMVTSFELMPSNGLTTEAKWTIDGIEIIQKLIASDEEDHAGNVKIVYEVNNTTNKAVSIGSRILLDTMVAANDGSPIVLDNSERITHEHAYLGDDLPIAWKATDKDVAKTTVAFGLLSGWRDDVRSLKPDELIVGHWEGLSKTLWDYEINEELDFTSSSNIYGSSDSAVAIKWLPKELKSGKSVFYETYYGIGKFATVACDFPMDFSLNGPDRVHLTSDLSKYHEDKITIKGFIGNDLEGSKDLVNAKLSLVYTGAGLTMNDSDKVIQLGRLNAGTQKNFEFTFRTEEINFWDIVNYEVVLSADNMTQSQSRNGFVMIPALSGQVPEIIFTDLAPKNIYYQDDDKSFSIIGSGLNTLKTKNLVITLNSPGGIYTVPEGDLEIKDKKITVKLPRSFENLGSYRVTLEYGNTERVTYSPSSQLVLSSDDKYMKRSYGVLMVLKEGEGNMVEYNIVVEKDPEALAKYEKDENGEDNEDLLITIKGNIVEQSGVYTVQSKTALLNSIVAVHTLDPLFDDYMTIEYSEVPIIGGKNGVSISGAGTMTLGDFPIHLGPYEISFTDTYEKEDITIERPLVYSKGIGVANVLISKLPIKLNEAKLGNQQVSLGGELDVIEVVTGAVEFFEEKEEEQEKDENKDEDKEEEEEEEDDDELEVCLSIDDLVFKVENNAIVFGGFAATGKFALPSEYAEKVIPGGALDIGAEAEISIDTTDNKFDLDLEAGFDFEVIEAEAEIALKTAEFYGVPLIIPDTVKVYGGGEPGIPLIPTTPVAYLKGLGGGFSNLYDTITLNFKMLPPLALHATASADLFKVFAVNKAELTVSMQKIGLFIESLAISKLDIFRDLEINMTVKDDPYYPGVAMNARGGIEVDLHYVALNGTAGFVAKYDSAYNGPLGPVYLSGDASADVGTTDKMFWPLKKKNLGKVLFEINTDNIFGRAKFWIFSISIRYAWGGSPVVGTSLEESGALVSEAVYRDGQNVGQLTIGENISKIYDSTKTNVVTVSDVSGNQFNNHMINVNNGDSILFGVEYFTDQPNVIVVRPDGTLFDIDTPRETDEELVEFSSDGDRKYVLIGIHHPEKGGWQVRCADTIIVEGYSFAALPEVTLTEAKFENDQLEVKWDKVLVNNETIVMTLINKETQERFILDDRSVLASASQGSYGLPVTLPSGNYDARLQMIDHQGAVFGAAIDVGAYTNANQPSQVANLQATYAGNGLYKVSWDQVLNADGYYIDVMKCENESEDWSSVMTYNTEEIENIIGGTFNMNTGEVSGESMFEQMGMVPGETYKIGVYAYKMVDGQTVYSELNEVTRKVQKPQNIDVDYTFEEFDLVEMTTENGLSIEAIDSDLPYATNKSVIQLKLKKEEGMTYVVRLNGTLVPFDQASETYLFHLVSGDNQFTIRAIHESGDFTMVGDVIKYDDQAPTLFIESPQPGDLVDDIIIKGHVEITSRLLVNGKEVSYNEDGTFEYLDSFDGQLFKTIQVEALDEVGNSALYEASVINNKLNHMNRLSLENERINLSKGEKHQVRAFVLDDEGNKLEVNPDMLNWTLLEDNDVVDVENGILTGLNKGQNAVIAQLVISSDFALSDAVMVTVGGEKDILEIVSSVDSINLSRFSSYELVLYEKDAHGKLYPLNNGFATFEANNSGVSVSEEGVIRANNVGNSVITITYLFNGKVLTETVSVRVTGGSSNNDDDDDDDVVVRVIEEEETPLSDIQFSRPFISGYPDGTFRPSNLITRAEVATIFASILELDIDNAKAQKYTDVPASHWSYPYVQAISEVGLFGGYEDGSFRPQAPITRAEIAQVFTNYWTYSEFEFDASSKILFKDVTESHWAIGAVNRMINSGLFIDYAKVNFKPNEPTLRIELIRMINNLLGRKSQEGESLFSDITDNYKYIGDVNSASKPYAITDQ
ncbi:S-layer homology domain-containing protein [Acidaminobacter sp. JC074]|uniref:S-layer homology domain-containing protein n=1 Tax=Acidaminobacter sp. JC074 TaxID=2530199 RepID=UPI001F1095C6|nr:S-layer homology domain-containing protein [Acidaminobacter sp. JC074]MCH4890324.1 S-layer homology domain-containing protein [Acidaminobacter sp. JC074]